MQKGLNPKAREQGTWSAKRVLSECSCFSVAALGFPGGSDGKESACNVGDLGLIPGWEVIPLQYSCLENSMDRGAWWVTVHGVAKSWTQLSD